MCIPDTGTDVNVPQTPLSLGAPFFENPDNEKSVVIFIQDRCFNSFAENIIRLSVKKAKLTGLLARPPSLILWILI